MVGHSAILRCVGLLFWLLADLASARAADIPMGLKTIYLEDHAGQEQPIGTVEFVNPDGSGSIQYRLAMDYGRFKDFFLSMKEMKCLEGKELWCHIPYPYANPHTVTAANLSWLEHDLLFMFKGPKEFGANFWNGIYYRMSAADGVIRGTAHAVDLNKLAAPPDDLTVPPFGEYDIDPISSDEHWLPTLIIR